MKNNQNKNREEKREIVTRKRLKEAKTASVKDIPVLNRTPKYQDMSDEEKEVIVKKAIQESNEDQKALVDRSKTIQAKVEEFFKEFPWLKDLVGTDMKGQPREKIARWLERVLAEIEAEERRTYPSRLNSCLEQIKQII